MSDLVLTMLMIAGGIMMLAMVLTFVRFLMGPGLVDRTIAFDVMTVGSLGFIALISVLYGKEMYLDVNLIYGLLSFTAVVVVGKYIEKKL